MGIEPTTSGIDLPLLCRLSYEVGQRKSGTIRKTCSLCQTPSFERQFLQISANRIGKYMERLSSVVCLGLVIFVLVWKCTCSLGEPIRSHVLVFFFFFISANLMNSKKSREKGSYHFRALFVNWHKWCDVIVMVLVFSNVSEKNRLHYSLLLTDSGGRRSGAWLVPWGPFLERPGNLTGPESDFDQGLKKSRAYSDLWWSLFCFFSWKLYGTIFKPFETTSRMENKTA